MISDSHSGLINAIRRMLQGSCWQRCRVHFAGNLLQTVRRQCSCPAANELDAGHQTVPKAHQEMVAAALRSVFAQQSKEAVLEQWHQVSAMLAAKFPEVVWLSWTAPIVNL